MGSTSLTVGVEEEYQVVDPESGALVGRAPDVLELDRTGTVKQEYQRTMLEVATPVCATVEEAMTRLRERRRCAASLAEAEGLAIAAAGLHPLGPHPATQLSDAPQYWQLAARGGIVARELHIFGMHVHVAVPDEEAAVRALGGIAAHLPQLLALSASSPFHRGQDTQFHSFRTMLRDMFPRVGPPLPVESAAEFRRMVRLLRELDGQEEDETRTIAWDLRPSAKFPTLEFRFFDVSPWLDSAAFLAGCARALTAVFIDSPPPPGTALQLQLLRENRWQAARFGLTAKQLRLDPLDGKQQSAADALRATVDRLGPVAEGLGDGAALARVEQLIARGTAADAMRAAHRREHSLRAVTDWLIGETRVG